MNSSLSRDDSEDEPKGKEDYKLDDFEMVKTIGTGKAGVETGTYIPLSTL